MGLCCDMSKTKQLGLIFVLIATFIGFIWGIWKGQQKSLVYKKNGVEITCTVVNVSSLKKKIRFSSVAFYQFTDNKGAIHVTEIPFIKIKPRTGNDYDIIYMFEANGKCYAKLKQDL